MAPEVSDELALRLERLAAAFAGVGLGHLLARVNPEVLVEVALHTEPPAAVLAEERLLARVAPHVPDELTAAREHLVTVLARVGHLTG